MKFNWNQIGLKEFFVVIVVIGIIGGAMALMPSSPKEKSPRAQMATPTQSPSPEVKQTNPTLEADRLNAFNDLESNNVDRPFYRGVEVRGRQVTIKIADAWHLLSRDRKEALCHGMFSRWFALGGPRGIKEDSSDFRFQFRHAESGRVIATWDSLSGISIKE